MAKEKDFLLFQPLKIISKIYKYMSEPIYTLVVPFQFEAILKRLKNKKPDVFKNLENKIEKVIREPILGKPL